MPRQEKHSAGVPESAREGAMHVLQKAWPQGALTRRSPKGILSMQTQRERLELHEIYKREVGRGQGCW